MTMIKMTYTDDESVAVVSWTPEYGVIAAGPKALLDRIEVEIIESAEQPWAPPGPHLAAVPSLTPQEMAALEREAAAPIPTVNKKACVSCGHTDVHSDDADPPGCTHPGCVCYTAVYP